MFGDFGCQDFYHLLWIAKSGDDEFIIGGYYNKYTDMQAAKNLYRILLGCRAQFIEDKIKP